MVQVTAPFSSRILRIARAISEKKPERYVLSSEDKRIARHAAHDGYTLAQIKDIIGYKGGVESLKNKLRKCNIRTRRSIDITFRRKDT